jgi:hypothetical protein
MGVQQRLQRALTALDIQPALANAPMCHPADRRQRQEHG